MDCARSVGTNFLALTSTKDKEYLVMHLSEPMTRVSKQGGNLGARQERHGKKKGKNEFIREARKPFPALWPGIKHITNLPPLPHPVICLVQLLVEWDTVVPINHSISKV